MNTAILLVDRDLGFLFWLGRLLDQAGYQAFPAKSAPDAVALTSQMQLNVTLLVLNCSLPGAEALVHRLREDHRHLKVIALATPGEEQPDLTFHVDAISYRPAEANEDAKTEWLQIVHWVLSPNLSSSAGVRR